VVMNRLVDAGNCPNFVPTKTHMLTLAGGDLDGQKGVKAYKKELAKAYPLAGEEVEWLVNLYGKNAEVILDAAERGADGKIGKGALVRAVQEYAVAHEACCTMSDFFTRRTALLYFGRPWIAPVQAQVEADFKRLLGAEWHPDPNGQFAREYADVVDFS
ncbi:MAG: glycerol-3-phosphate dehydrogenase C-terminal domain-containing protein, partial [Bacteroidota bacterium]